MALHAILKMAPVVGILKVLYCSCEGKLKFELALHAILKMAPVVGSWKVLYCSCKGNLNFEVARVAMFKKWRTWWEV
jgi:hypothetical protein